MGKLRIYLTKTINGWVVLGSLVLTGLLVWILLATLHPARTLEPAAPADLVVIPAPTATLKVFSTALPTPTSTQSPVIVNSGDIAIGVYVQISGTGGDGLRIRSGAGLSFQPRFLGFESEAFEVRDGPKQADGYTWWYLVAPYDSNRSGWAVENYLAIVAISP
jgi:hypothetical protein